eukprot:gene30308-36622_t
MENRMDRARTDKKFQTKIGLISQITSSKMDVTDIEKSVCALEPDQPRQNALFAIPKKGRLYDRIVKLLTGSGLDHHRPNRLDVAQCTNLPVTLVFLPAADIATYVAEGNVD